MSEHELQAGDIRADEKMVYLVVFDVDSGALKLVYFTNYSGKKEFSESMCPSLCGDKIRPSSEHRFICNINETLFKLERKIQKEILK